MCENCNQPDYRYEYLRVQAELVEAKAKLIEVTYDCRELAIHLRNSISETKKALIKRDEAMEEIKQLQECIAAMTHSLNKPDCTR